MEKFSKKNISKAVLEFMIFGFGIKILGFLRSILMADKFGLSMESDIFYLILSFIFILATLMGKSLQTTLIPILSQAEIEGGANRKRSVFNNILTNLGLLSLLTCIVVFFFAEEILHFVYAQKIGLEANKLAVELLKIGLPIIFFYNVASVYRSYLQSEMMFRESSLSLYPVNLAYIFYLLFFVGFFGIHGLMFAYVLGVAFQLVIQWPALRSFGYRYKPTINWQDPLLRKALSQLGPILIGIAATDLNTIVDKSLASMLAIGSISALEYGLQFTTSTRMLFISVINQVMYPLLSRTAGEKNFEKLRSLLNKTGRYVLLIAVPACLLMMTFSLEIIQILYQRGAFGPEESAMAAVALFWYAFGLVFISLEELCVQIFYSIANVRIPVFTSVFSLLLNFILNLIFMRLMGHGGLAFATSLSSFCSVIFLLFMLKRNLNFHLGRKDLLYFVKIFVLSALSILIMRLFYLGLEDFFLKLPLGNFLLFGLSGFFALLVYVLGIYFSKLEEGQELIQAFKAKRKKLDA